MKPELRDDQDDRQGYDRASFLKAGALAVALGVATWLLAPILLPVKIPQDFPKLPDLETVNRSYSRAAEERGSGSTTASWIGRSDG